MEGDSKVARVGLLSQQKEIVEGKEQAGGQGKEQEAGRVLAASCLVLTNITDTVIISDQTFARLPLLKSLLFQACGPQPTPQPPQPSRHSPPVSRAPKGPPRPPLEGLGGLAEVWGQQASWDQFMLWLAGQSEGEDSEGVPLLLARYYLINLQLYYTKTIPCFLKASI